MTWKWDLSLLISWNKNLRKVDLNGKAWFFTTKWFHYANTMDIYLLLVTDGGYKKRRLNLSPACRKKPPNWILTTDRTILESFSCLMLLCWLLECVAFERGNSVRLRICIQWRWQRGFGGLGDFAPPHPPQNHTLSPSCCQEKRPGKIHFRGKKKFEFCHRELKFWEHYFERKSGV